MNLRKIDVYEFQKRNCVMQFLFSTLFCPVFPGRHSVLRFEFF